MACKNCGTHKLKSIRLFGRFFTILAPYALIYIWLTTQINRLYLISTGQASEMTTEQVLSANALIVPAIGIVVAVPDPIAAAVIGCIVVGVGVYIALEYLCRQEWVQEPVQIKECWEEVKWYNPWSWITAIVCTVTEILKWVVKQVCGFTEVLVTVLIILCSIVVVAAILA